MSEATAPDALGCPEDRVVLFADGRELQVRDVIRAGLFRGDIEERWRLLLAKVTCQQHAVENEIEPDLEKLQAIADKFRYDRDLITSEETDEWMRIRALNQEIFSNHVMRTYWQEELGEEVETREDVFADPDEASKHFTYELLLGGGFYYVTRKLAWRMAARHTADAGNPALAERIEAERTLLLERTGLAPEQLPGWVAGLGANDAWLEEMLAIEAAFALHREKIITPEGLSRYLRTRRLGLMRFEVEEIEFDSMGAAQEGVLCVRNDGLSMEEVASESGFSYQKRDFLLEEQPPDWQTALISTPEQGVVPPIADEEVVRLFRVLRKTEPTLDDPEVRERLEEAFLESAFEELCAAHHYKLQV
jgi:hypothetical protein